MQPLIFDRNQPKRKIMNAFFKKIFNRDDRGASEPMIEIALPKPEVNQERIQRAAESILGNERLTADLDDETAKELLDWGVALAQQIASDTAAMDDTAAEEAMYQPMRALRKMVRAINQWTLEPNEIGLKKIIGQARAIYGPDYIVPGPDQCAQFTNQVIVWSDHPLEMIRQLRQFIEDSNYLDQAS